MNRVVRGLFICLVMMASGCASLGGIGILPPLFSVDSQQASELRLAGPSLQHPLGAAVVRLYARVENPNPVGFTLSRLAGALSLQGQHAANADFPLGVPLAAGQSAVVPLDITVGLANLPGLADVVSRAVSNGQIGYALQGTVSVDAGVFGQPSFGPMMLMEGSVSARR